MRLFVMGENAWRDFGSWPPAGYEPRRFRLQAGGALSAGSGSAGSGSAEPDLAAGGDSAQNAGPDRYRYDPADRRPRWAGCAWVLSDDEVCGLIGVAARLEGWAAELKLAAVGELDARRAGPDGREGAHVAKEVAAVLRQTGRSAGALLEPVWGLERLPAARAMLAAGLVDVRRAGVIAGYTAVLPAGLAVTVADAVLPRAAGMTSSDSRYMTIMTTRSQSGSSRGPTRASFGGWTRSMRTARSSASSLSGSCA